MLSRWVASGADFADATVAAASGAILASVINDLQVERVPARLWESFFQISLCLHDVAPPGQAPALCQAMNVRIDRKGRQSKCLRHDDAGRFVADAREFFEFLLGLWHPAVISLGEDLSQALDVLCFGWCEAACSDGGQNFFDG